MLCQLFPALGAISECCKTLTEVEILSTDGAHQCCTSDAEKPLENSGEDDNCCGDNCQCIHSTSVFTNFLSKADQVATSIIVSRQLHFYEENLPQPFISLIFHPPSE
jgi:hypothetical protein